MLDIGAIPSRFTSFRVNSTARTDMIVSSPGMIENSYAPEYEGPSRRANITARSAPSCGFFSQNSRNIGNSSVTPSAPVSTAMPLAEIPYFCPLPSARQ